MQANTSERQRTPTETPVDATSEDGSEVGSGSDSPRVLTVVSCGATKKNIAGLERVPARELYSSTVHTCKDRYGRHSHAYYIMSARHGLVHNQEKIGYYDETLDEKTDFQVRLWGHWVACDIMREIEAADQEFDAVVLIGSKTYVRGIIESSSLIPTPILTPWQTDDYVTGVGRGMAWANNEENWPVNVDSIEEIGEPVEPEWMSEQ